MRELILDSSVDRTRNLKQAGPFQAELSLMRSIACGDQAALEQLVSQYGKTLATLIGRLMAWHPDCDDILQEVLLIVWQRADDYRGTGPLEGWLKRISINQCQNHFRTTNVWRRKLKQFAERISPYKETSTTVYPNLSSDSAAIENESLDQAMAQLTHDDRLSVVLFYLEGYSGKEVAQQLGIEVDTLHVRLHRIKKRLKSLMESE